MHNQYSLIIPFLHFEHELERELVLNSIKIFEKNQHYFKTEAVSKSFLWAREVLNNCTEIHAATKNEAVKILRSLPNLGCFLPSPHGVNFSTSIRKELRELKLKRLKFEVPGKFNFKYFVWTVGEDGSLIICETPRAQYPLGWHEFDEDKTSPPNRAYLKLWESLTLGHIRLNPRDVVVDLGACPGGWTWVLSDLTRKVYSVDKAPLNADIASRPNVNYYGEDAFAINPATFKDSTWMFSDIICTPQRLLDLVHSWLKAGYVKNYHCTIKFKGDCDFDVLNEFRKIEDSKIIHLYQNKNEVTWIRQIKQP